MSENKDVIFFFFFASKFMDTLNLSTQLLGLSAGPCNGLRTVPARTEPRVDKTHLGWTEAVRQLEG